MTKRSWVRFPLSSRVCVLDHVLYHQCFVLVLPRARSAVIHLGPIATKPVFGVSDKVIFKQVSSATETRQKIKFLLGACLDEILSKKRITKALISLRECAGWSATLLFANPRRQVFSRRGPFGSVLDLGRGASVESRSSDPPNPSPTLPLSHRLAPVLKTIFHQCAISYTCN